MEPGLRHVRPDLRKAKHRTPPGQLPFRQNRHRTLPGRRQEVQHKRQQPEQAVTHGDTIPRREGGSPKAHGRFEGEADQLRILRGQHQEGVRVGRGVRKLQERIETE